MWNTFFEDMKIETMNIYAVIDHFCESPIKQRAKHIIFVSAIDINFTLMSDNRREEIDIISIELIHKLYMIIGALIDLTVK